MKRIGVCWWRVRLPGLAAFLDAEIHYHPFLPSRLKSLDAITGWGRKPSYLKAERIARKTGLPLISLEDGFLRSVGMGASDPPLSLIADDLGIYYDATRPSRLEAMIAAPKSDAEAARARDLAARWRAGRLSKYNHSRDHRLNLPPRYVLAADQTAGDASIRYGLAGPESFRAMLDAALKDNPDCVVVLKIHPEVMAGRKTGHFDLLELAKNPRIVVLGEDVHPASLIAGAEALYAVTSQMGFEGLLWGKQVHCFGMPFYAGWGLTKDALAAPDRRHAVSIENLVHAALVDYPRYLDPETGERCEAERIMDWLALQRKMRQRFPERLEAFGFSPWKQPMVRSFLDGSTIRFWGEESTPGPGETGGIVIWGRKPIPADAPEGAPVLRLEDGFIRSVGIGADLVRPLSWVVDDLGIYYDATQPSRLEAILAAHDFDDALKERAAALRRVIVAAAITKYNVGAMPWKRPERAPRVILVPGQVETDAAIRFGAPGICRNLDLLKAVRAENPEAYIIYKPHPDVLANLRDEGVGEEQARDHCDEIVTDCPMGTLLDSVDEVHVMTSLAGFEALMREKRVVAYGQPFYAGWGLTEDRIPIARRRRKLDLDSLAAAALILYPTYISRTSGRFTTPERAVEELAAWRAAAPSSRQRLIRGLMRPLLVAFRKLAGRR